jgi:hypothetical protein
MRQADEDLWPRALLSPHRAFDVVDGVHEVASSQQLDELAVTGQVGVGVGRRLRGGQLTHGNTVDRDFVHDDLRGLQSGIADIYIITVILFFVNCYGSANEESNPCNR